MVVITHCVILLSLRNPVKGSQPHLQVATLMTDSFTHRCCGSCVEMIHATSNHITTTVADHKSSWRSSTSNFPSWSTNIIDLWWLVKERCISNSFTHMWPPPPALPPPRSLIRLSLETYKVNQNRNSRGELLMEVDTTAECPFPRTCLHFLDLQERENEGGRGGSKKLTFLGFQFKSKQPPSYRLLRRMHIKPPI